MTSLFLSHLHLTVESRSGPIGTVTSRLSVYRICSPRTVRRVTVESVRLISIREGLLIAFRMESWICCRCSGEPLIRRPVVDPLGGRRPLLEPPERPIVRLSPEALPPCSWALCIASRGSSLSSRLITQLPIMLSASSTAATASGIVASPAEEPAKTKATKTRQTSWGKRLVVMASPPVRLYHVNLSN